MTPRRLLVTAAAFTALGLAIASASPVAGTAGGDHTQVRQVVGGILVLAGWALLVLAIHRFGREQGT